MDPIRRYLNLSGESTDSTDSGISVSLQADIRTANALSEILDNALDEDICGQQGISTSTTNTTALTRLLSLRSTFSTASYFTHLQQSMRHCKSTFRRIGFGQCGLIFEQPSRGFVVKLARQHFADALWTDIVTHVRIYEALAERDVACRVPCVYRYISESSKEWWEEHAQFFTDHQGLIQLPTMALVTQRILPLPKTVRELLIDCYCPDALKESVKADPSNRDCLSRVYLGRSRVRDAPKSPNFTLRNFNLHLDQMLELGLNIYEYATGIAEALALIHWAANVDAYDIEFVLGNEAEVECHVEESQRPLVRLNADQLESVAAHTSLDELITVDFKERSTRLWVLDFNLCSRWDMATITAAGQEEQLIDQLVHAFFGNDPYYPMPITPDRKDIEDGADKDFLCDLWRTFSTAYLRRAESILEGGSERLLDLPKRFVSLCVDEARNGKSFK